MKKIIGPKRNIFNILGQQRYFKNKKYRMSIYSIPLEVSEGMLLYNNLTKEMLLLSSDEYDEIPENIREYMVQNWFMVPNNISEYSIYYAFEEIYRKAHRINTYGKLSMCAVFPTTACNARCPYCYEKGITPKNMTKEVANRLVSWLLPRAADKLCMYWFGGEPLCNEEIMDYICEKLADKGVDFWSRIITNGLLFSPEKMDKYISLWRLRRVQITIDGTHDTYINTKNFKAVTEDPYVRILNNIEMLAKQGIKVEIRTHLSQNNKTELLALIDELAERFGKYKSVMMYVHPLFEGVGEMAVLSESQRDDLFHQFAEVTKYAYDRGVSGEYGIGTYRRAHCMADNGRSVCVTPEGNLTLCEHHCEDEIYGSIFSNKYDSDILKSWLEPADDLPDCMFCPYRPSCIRLKKCPVDYVCCNGHREYKHLLINLQMLGSYNEYKKNSENIA